MQIHKNRKEIKFQSPFIQIIKTPYTDTVGKKKEWDWVKRIGSQKAVIIAALFENKIVITKEYRVPIEDYEWGFPAGLINKGESVETAAHREFKEETGLNIEKINHISPPLYSSSGLTNESVFIVICTAKGTINQDLTGDSEDITTFLVSREKLKKMFQDKSKKWGAKSFMLMQRFALFGYLIPSKRKDVSTHKSINMRYRFSATHKLKENFIFSNGIEKVIFKKGNPVFIPKGNEKTNSNIFFLTPTGIIKVTKDQVLHIYSKTFFKPKKDWFEKIED